MPEAPTISRPDVLAALRRATAESHGRLEDRLDILERLRSMERRRELMAAFYGYFVVVERLLQPALATVPGLHMARRVKAGFLRRDLLDLGLSQDAIDGLPLCRVPAPGSVAMAMGYAYVTEGASLGGKVVHRQAASAGLPDTGMSFFGCYEPDTAPLWRDFCAILQTMGDTPLALSQIVGGAVLGFETIDRWFAERLGD